MATGTLPLKPLSLIPLLPSVWIFLTLLLNDPTFFAQTSEGAANDKNRLTSTASDTPSPTVGAQLLVYLALGISGYVGTNRLIPNIKVRYSIAWICGQHPSTNDVCIAKLIIPRTH